ncbi:uncharacterized protein LOC129597878 isoform X2 [Paramacrobiotus metropolitanus]|uniref:uncharacterized protein LOC129597878 isoform X2 n=1 Tax=Paramacrobiotus metropolitanus TaxID=2943436 RepID=UPI0024465A2A|nr:uncharacterized protein LOC129597878 isoform X2 [Paramacrobiotus metropolitanus]
MDDIREYLANKQEDVEGLIAVRDQQRADNALLRHRISALEKQYEFLRPVFDQEYKTRAVSDDEFTNQQGFEAVLEQIGNKILDIQKLKETASHAINHCLQSVEEPEQLSCSAMQ